MKHQLLIPTVINTLYIFLMIHPRTTSAQCVTPQTVCQGPGPSKRPLPGCNTFAQCDTLLETTIAFQTCLAGSIFDDLLEICNWESSTFCNVRSCRPTMNPTGEPTSERPTVSPTNRPTGELLMYCLWMKKCDCLLIIDLKVEFVRIYFCESFVFDSLAWFNPLDKFER